MAGVERSKLAAWMEPFRQGFTNPTWPHVLVLIAGAILSPGRRTVAAALRVTGLDQDPCFTNYHRVLNRNRWSSRRAARCLLRLLVSSFFPDGPVIIGVKSLPTPTPISRPIATPVAVTELSVGRLTFLMEGA